MEQLVAVDGGETENGYVGCCYWSHWEWRWSLNCGTAVTTGGQGEGYPDRNSGVANCFLLWSSLVELEIETVWWVTVD